VVLMLVARCTYTWKLAFGVLNVCRERREHVDCRLHRSLEFSARFTACNVTAECRGRLTIGTHPHSLQLIVDPGCLVIIVFV